MRRAGAPPIIAHLVRDYLHPSENWIHTQISTQTRTQPIVLTKNLKNLREFPATVYKYHLLSDSIQVRSIWLLLLRKTLAVIERFRNALFYTEINYYTQIVRQTKANLIHAHYGPTGVLGVTLKAKTGLPLIVSFYGSDASRLLVQPQWQRRYQSVFSQADAIIVMGTYMYRKLQKFGCPAQKLHRISPGINLASFPFRPRKPTACPKLLLAARLEPVKGISYALKAIKQVTAQKIPLTVTIVGSGSEASKIKQLITTLKLHRQVTMLPFVSLQKLANITNQHDIFLHPSITTEEGQQEGIPTTIIERVASGMPIIATHHSDIPAIVQDGINGILVPEKDISALAKAIISLAKHPNLRVKFAYNGRKLVESNFDAQKQTAKREELYMKLIS